MAEIAERRDAYPLAAEEYLKAAERSTDPTAAQRATEFALDYGFDAYALRAARRWVRIAPDSRLARRDLARLLLTRNDVDGAWEQVQKELELGADSGPPDYLKLAADVGQSSSGLALTQLLTRLRATSPASPSLDMAVAAAALGSGDNDLAIDAATSAAGGSPDIATDVLIARALMAKGEKTAGLEHVARHLGPNARLELNLEHARMLAGAGNHAEALAELTELDGRFPNQPEIVRLRGLVNFDSGDFKSAWEQFGILVTNGRFVPESMFYLGQIAEKQTAWDDALHFYDRVGEGPQLLPSLAGIIRIAERNADPASALQRLDEFARNHPRYALESLRYRAGLLARSDRPADGVNALSEGLRYKPDDEGLRLARSELLDQLGRYDESIADLRIAVARAPDSALTLNALGYSLANRTRHHDEGYQFVRRALEIDADNPAILDSLGWAFFRQGRLQEAQTYLQATYAVFPDPEVSAHLGEVLWRRGQPDRARALWKDALEKSPDSKPLQETVARFVK